jgi:hypothetical protein
MANAKVYKAQEGSHHRKAIHRGARRAHTRGGGTGQARAVEVNRA